MRVIVLYKKDPTDFLALSKSLLYQKFYFLDIKNVIYLFSDIKICIKIIFSDVRKYFKNTKTAPQKLINFLK